MCKVTPTLIISMPLMPLPKHSMSIPFRVTMLPAGALKMMPLMPEARTPPSVESQTMLIDLVMVTAPAPFGSRQLISPPADVLEIAPAKVLHGAVRLQGLRSSPTPDTQLRV